MALNRAVARAADLIVQDFNALKIGRAVITSGYRSLKKQAELYAAYKKGGPLAAAPGKSAHNYGLAVDIAIVGAKSSDRRYAQLHRIGRRHGLVPLNGRARRVDPFHLEVPQWRRFVG